MQAEGSSPPIQPKQGALLSAGGHVCAHQPARQPALLPACALSPRTKDRVGLCLLPALPATSTQQTVCAQAKFVSGKSVKID